MLADRSIQAVLIQLIQQALQRYMAFFAWSLAQWIAFTQLIVRNRPSADENDANAVARQTSNDSNLDLITKILFGVMLCAAILLGEKFAIQWMYVICSWLPI